jgi:hypothetical protein
MLFLIRAQRLRRRAYWFYALAGLMIGISAWLRSQAMLMGLFFLVVLTLISERRMRMIAQTAVMAAVSLLVIAPITIKNYVVYGEFVPINIGMGIVLLEGIGESSDGRFGAPVTDLEVAEQEAILYGNPEYAGSWSTPDGIMRDRNRIKRSLDIIAGHPVWYAGVMLKRMVRMVKYSADAELVHTGDAPDPDQRSEPVRREWRRLDQNSSPLILGRSFGWIRPPARAAQRAAKETLLLFILVGTALMFIVSRRRAMLILLVPVYYFISQSFLHTEFRYTLPMQYFLFVPAAIVWVLVMIGIWRSGKTLLTRWSPKSFDLPAL